MVSIWAQWDDIDDIVDQINESKADNISLTLHGKSYSIKANMSMFQLARELAQVGAL